MSCWINNYNKMIPATPCLGFLYLWVFKHRCWRSSSFQF